MRFTPPNFIRRLVPSVVWGFDSSDRVFLTFDDGPTPGVTEWVLDRLAAHNAKATFFCLGRNAEQHPELIERIRQDGHKVGNHTYSHQKGWQQGLRRYVEDVDFANQILRTDLFRPPYGRITPGQVMVLGERYNIIMWDVLSRDYSRYISPQACLLNVTKHVRGGSIVVFHDSQKAFRNLYYTLPRTLKHIEKLGLKCSSIDI